MQEDIIIDLIEAPTPSHIDVESVPNKDVSKVGQITFIQVFEN